MPTGHTPAPAQDVGAAGTSGIISIILLIIALIR